MRETAEVCLAVVCFVAAVAGFAADVFAAAVVDGFAVVAAAVVVVVVVGG